MSNYSEIWNRVKKFEDVQKELKRKRSERKLKSVSKMEEVSLEVEDLTLSDEAVESEDEENELIHIGNAIDYRTIKEYQVPPFNPGKPNLVKNGALKKYKDRFGKYLAFIDCVKFYRSSKYCSILAIATTSNALLSIWGSEKNISNALKELKNIGLLSDYNNYYQTGICKQYCYYIEIEKQLIQYCKENDIPKTIIKNRQELTTKQREEYQVRSKEVYSKGFKIFIPLKIIIKHISIICQAQF